MQILAAADTDPPWPSGSVSIAPADTGRPPRPQIAGIHILAEREKTSFCLYVPQKKHEKIYNTVIKKYQKSNTASLLILHLHKRGC